MPIKSQKSKTFPSSWTFGDKRPRIEACGINGKSGWIQVYDGTAYYSGKVSKALVKSLMKSDGVTDS